MRLPGVVVATLMMTASPAMTTGRSRVAQRAGQKGLHQFLRGTARPAGVDHDSVLGEQIQRAMPHAPRDDDLGALFMQPAGQDPRRVRRRDSPRLAHDAFGFGVRFDQRELFGMAEVLGQTSGEQRYGDFHSRVISSRWFGVVCFREFRFAVPERTRVHLPWHGFHFGC